MKKLASNPRRIGGSQNGFFRMDVQGVEPRSGGGKARADSFFRKARVIIKLSGDSAAFHEGCLTLSSRAGQLKFSAGLIDRGGRGPAPSFQSLGVETGQGGARFYSLSHVRHKLGDGARNFKAHLAATCGLHQAQKPLLPFKALLLDKLGLCHRHGRALVRRFIGGYANV